jgi:hypothetical protein
VEYPTEDEIRAMTNREFASLIRSQAEFIDRQLRRDDIRAPDGQGRALRL